MSKKILSNSAWMMFEKVISMFGLIFVMSYVAKYIGPSNFGKITLATTVFTFIQAITWFGNQDIVFKRVSRNSNMGLQYLQSTQRIRRLIFLILTIPVLIWFYYFSDFLTFIFGLATGLASFFLVQDIFVVYNNATLNSYINTIVNILGLMIALLARYIIVFFKLDASFLSIPIILVTLIPFTLKKYWFNRKLIGKVVKANKYTKYYIFAGSSLVISSLSIILYTQVTTLILAKLTSTYELGLYSVAVTLGMAWSFVNQSIISSVLSKIYQEKKDYIAYTMFAKLNLLVVAISVCAILGILVLGKWVIEVLYGQAYLKSFPLLIIMAFAAMFSGLGTIAARLIIREEGYKYISKKMLYMAISSIPIAYGFIYFYGLIGAAYSIAFIEFLSATLFNYFYRNGLILKVHLYPVYRFKGQ
ncbi:oligosaccharide flippase family protein [Acinetobacter soli]|uniref:oligosaccharide flippase family protein n=1 Tax=Acinetobacter soli TaxID=487316 RepID=UPI0026DF2F6C|nr:oligosaccharide flippase family protein [Acinetobacter soli]